MSGQSPKRHPGLARGPRGGSCSPDTWVSPSGRAAVTGMAACPGPVAGTEVAPAAAPFQQLRRGRQVGLQVGPRPPPPVYILISAWARVSLRR